MTPEFSRAERLDTIGEVARIVTIEADAAERAALAERFGLLAVGRLAAELSLAREATGIVARGCVTAAVTQACIATGDPVAAAIDEAVALCFVDEADAEEDEVELDLDALDTMPIEGGAIDLGEAAAETMALALDPFPRSAGAAEALKRAGVMTEAEARPPGAFAGLRERLADRQA